MDPEVQIDEALATEALSPGIAARMLFKTMDLVYGREASLPKFRVLEVVARVPYIAWEHVSYVAITHTHSTPAFARAIHDDVNRHRAAQDNEFFHLLILEELLQQRGVHLGFIRHRLLPQVLAWAYYHLSWLLYVVRPEMSYALNAQFEHHAEHEYLAYVDATPQVDTEAWISQFSEDYGPHETIGDVLRSVALDERHHKMESLALIDRARFGDR